MSKSTEIVVVGNGLFGSAATRHLVERGHQVIAIGAPHHSPDIRGAAPSEWPAHRVYASHNDAARLTRRQDRNPAWAEVTARAIGNYHELADRSGVTFFHEVGCLIASRPGGDGTNSDPLRVMDATNVDYSLYSPGDRSWRSKWPRLAFPETHYVAHEPTLAGYLQPKRLIVAQNKLALRAGATLVSDTVIDIAQSASGYVVRTASGRTVGAERVLIAAGGFSNFNNLLPDPAAIRMKSEVIALGEVSDKDAAQLRDYPTVKYLNDPGDLDAIYMVSAVQYEDGHHYIKMGANTSLDFWMTELDEIQQWFATDTDADYLPLYEPALRALWPSVDFVSMRTQPCLITYTDDRFPMVRDLGDGLYIAAAGNGGGAKGSDAWGEIAAEMMSG